MRKQLISLRRW